MLQALRHCLIFNNFWMSYLSIYMSLNEKKKKLDFLVSSILLRSGGGARLLFLSKLF